MSSQTTHEVVEFLITQMSVFVALLLTASALHKVLRFERARKAAGDLLTLNRRWAAAAVVVAISLEAAAALLIFVPGARSSGTGLAAGIFAAYLVSILRAIAVDRRDVDCGCSFGSRHRSLGAFEVSRNSTLLVTAILIAIGSSATETSLSLRDLLPALVFLALYFALDEVAAVEPIPRKIHS